MLKSLGYALGFERSPQDLANVNEWKIMFDPYIEQLLTFQVFMSFLPFFFRFVPDKGFTGVDSSRRRDGPVQFERYEEEDPFGLDKFLKEAKTGQKRGADDSRSSRDYDRKKRRE